MPATGDVASVSLNCFTYSAVTERGALIVTETGFVLPLASSDHSSKLQRLPASIATVASAETLMTVPES